MTAYYPTIDMEATGRRIVELRKKNNLSVADISSYMGFENPQAVYKWQQGKSLPTVDNIFALSKLFGTSIDDILVETSKDRSRAEGREPSLFLNSFFKIFSHYHLY